MGKIKGIILDDIKKTIRDIHGPDGLEKVISSLPEPVRKTVEAVYSKISWVEYKDVIQFGITADRILGKGDFQLFEKIAANSAQSQLKGIYKIFICLTSPKVFFKRLPFLWQRYFSEGRIEIVAIGDKSAVVKITDFKDMPRHHEHDFMAYVAEALKLTGAHHIAFSHSKCLARGDQHCLTEFTWK